MNEIFTTQHVVSRVHFFDHSPESLLFNSLDWLCAPASISLFQRLLLLSQGEPLAKKTPLN